LLETKIENSDARSQKTNICEPTGVKHAKTEEKKVLDSLAQISEEDLSKKLSELGCRVDLTHILKTMETQGARLLFKIV
jgi:transcriptional regulator of NAD metabolism